MPTAASSRFDFDDLDAELATVRVAVYLRISLDRDGDEEAITRQREDAEREAKRRGWEIVEVYTDNSLSASRADVVRPAYEKMRRDYRSGMFDAIICYDLDRLTRQPRELEDWIDEAERRGLRIVTTNGEADLGTDGGRMFARVKAAVARSEIERKSARHKRANKQRAEKGAWAWTLRPYGYRRVDGQIVIVDDEAAIVRELFERYTKGESYRALAKDLNARGVPTITGTEWTGESLRESLRKPGYAGIVVYRGREMPDVEPTWPPIIDRRLWEDYLATRGARARGGWGNATKHLLSGLLICGVCGGRLYSKDDKRAGARVYVCRPGNHTYVHADPLDEIVEGILLERLRDRRIIRALRHVPDTAPIEAEVRKLERARANVVELLADGLVDRRQAREKARVLTDKLSTASARLAAMRRESPLTDLALSRSLPKRWRSLSVTEKRRVIDEIGLRVTVNKSRPGRRPLDENGKPIFDFRRLQIDWRNDGDDESLANEGTDIA